MSENERLAKQLAFSLEIDKEKNIFRQTHLSGHGRNENDAEHAWHMAIMAYLLREYANEEVDIGRVMLMCLIHDIVEIDAGDTYAYERKAWRLRRKEKMPPWVFFPYFRWSGRADGSSRIWGQPDTGVQICARHDNSSPHSEWFERGRWLAEHNVCSKQIYGRQTRPGRDPKFVRPYWQSHSKTYQAGHIRP